MNINELNILFGRCYNSGDFSELKGIVGYNVVLESFDCFYRVEGIDNVINTLNNSIKKQTIAHKGYYKYKGIIFWHVKECVIICDENSLQSIKMIKITRKRKTLLIEGIKAKDCLLTRGEIIK